MPQHATALPIRESYDCVRPLAARIANRLPRHKTIVVFDTYRAHAVLDRVLDALPAKTRVEFRKTWAQAVQDDPAALGDALRAILEGPCSAHDPASGKQPILLVVDDLEQILTTPKAGETVAIEDGYVPVLRGIIEAFVDVHSASHLLLTSRYRFALSDAQGQDLTSRLADIALPPMNQREQAKQLRAEGKDTEPIETQAALLDRCVAAGRGNPGLQSRLTRAVLTDAGVAEAAVEQVERFHQSGEIPTGDIGDFFQRLRLDVYRQALNGDETALVRAALLFEQPVPDAIIVAAGRAVGVEAIDLKLSRLEGLGLIDRFLAEGGPGASLMVNALARPLFEALSASDQQHVARAAVTPLADAWRDADADLPYGLRSLEVVGLAELAGDAPQLLGDAAEASGRWLFRGQHDAETALAVAEVGISGLRSAGLSPGIGLLRLAAEAAARLGEVSKQASFLEEGLTRDADDLSSQAMLWVDWADRLAGKGQMQEAETWLEKAEAAFTKLGDVRSIAISQGKIADILVHRGQYDEALRIRQEDQLPVYRQLDDVREIAISLFSIARTRMAKGIKSAEQVQGVLDELRESFKLLLEIRAPDGIATVGQMLGSILAQTGQTDEARQVLIAARDAFLALQRPGEAGALDQQISQLGD